MIGTGYVGLVSGACLSDFGHDVVCVDRDIEKIAVLNQARSRFTNLSWSGSSSPTKIAVVCASRLRSGRPSTDADVVFLAVGTPARRGDGHADLQFVYAAAKEIARFLKDFTVIVTKSTVPVGTGDEIERLMYEVNPAADFAVVSNPEFLREGAAIRDFKFPDRIVIGTDNVRAKDVMAKVYRPLSLNRLPILFTDRRAAELIKYAANAFLATKISFINEIADLCEKLGTDVQEVARGIGLDNRIGAKFLHAGPGFGGSCFPKDTLALIKTAEDHNSPVRIVEAVVAINETRKRAMSRKVVNMLNGDVRGKTIAVLGLTFKPNTDDMRDAPSIPLITALLDRGAKVKAFDPVGQDQAKMVLSDVEFCENPFQAAEDADALVIVTEWEQFRALDFKRLKKIMATPIVVDLRNIYRGEDLEKEGFAYEGVGKRSLRSWNGVERRKIHEEKKLLNETG